MDEKENFTAKIELGSVTVSSGAKFNLLSLTALMRLGWQLHGNKTSLILRKGNKQIKFQHQIKTEKVLLFVLRIKRDIKDEMANPSINEITEVSKIDKSSIQASTMKANTENDTRTKAQISVKRRSQAPKPSRNKISNFKHTFEGPIICLHV